MISAMERALIFIQTEKNIQEISKWILNQALGDTRTIMAIFMKEIGKMICIMVKEYKIMRLVQVMREHGILMRKMEKECSQMRKARNLNKFGIRVLKSVR